MRVGTRSLLYGAHCLAIHPWFFIGSHIRLFGPPRSAGGWARLFCAGFGHDLGYWGKPNMDGPEGERHPWFYARIARHLFDREEAERVLYHSRHLAKNAGRRYSDYCVADKLAVCEPWWLYLPRVMASGEINEYLAEARSGKYKGARHPTHSRRAWYASISAYLQAWAQTHKALDREDTWTNSRQTAR